jgi:ppGpp synthetase/RelA/SpoT-type nucleotidyltranferase
MIIANQIKKQFEYYAPYIEILSKNVSQTLLNFCIQNHYAYNYRNKELKSLAEKIETGRYKSWSALDDLFASTIIIPNLKNEAHVLDFLKSSFDIVEIKERGSTFKNANEFRFDATRVIARILNPTAEINIINKIIFEIQIRTAFEHAWSAATHTLAYKTDEINWKILRLTAQIKASVEQLDMLISGADEISMYINEHNEPNLVVKQDLISFFKEKFQSKKIPEEMTPKDYSRFVDNLFAFLNPILDYRPFKMIKQIKELIKKIDVAMSSYDIDNFPRSISLFQFISGLCIEQKFIDIESIKTTLFINEQLETIFPATKNITNRFEIEKSH